MRILWDILRKAVEETATDAEAHAAVGTEQVERSGRRVKGLMYALIRTSYDDNGSRWIICWGHGGMSTGVCASSDMGCLILW